MILYKYVGFEAGLKILETRSLGFSHLEDFNDPFECTGLGLYDLEVPLSVAINAFRNIFSRKYSILSLTRTHLNPLMWSHYADSYKGLVIGIDTQKAGFDDGGKFIIPTSKGEMRYLKTKPQNVNKATVENLESVGNSNKLNWENSESLLKHGLLYKMQEWAYEEEIRIVKNISSAKFGYHSAIKTEAMIDDQHWKRIQLETRPIYTLELPQEAFVEVYFGQNAYIDQRRKLEGKSSVENIYVNKIEDLKQICREYGLLLSRVGIDHDQWALKCEKIEI